ncbi:toll/interleukin-1 receptor domain-containing protein [Sorangium sp. So ce429]
MASKQVVSGQELISHHKAGERNFRGVDLAGADLTGAVLNRTDFTGATFSRATFFGATLIGATFVRASLVRTNFVDATLSDANLSAATLMSANFSGANLSSVNISVTNLSGASFSGTNLSGANLSGAHLSGANFGGAVLRGTLLINVDLSPLCAAHPAVRHEGPSFVDHHSVLRSIHAPRLKDFLSYTGVPEVFIEYMVDCARSLRMDVFKMLQSTFISYGAPDESFARKLYEALHSNGVTTFFFPEHAEPGEKLHRTMRKGVNEHDRVILICSRNSLDRKGVLNELEEILTREARDGGASYLIPIRLDDYVFTGWTPKNADVAQAVRDRVVADFEGAEADEPKFQAGLQKLIRALRKKTVEAGDLGRG